MFGYGGDPASSVSEYRDSISMAEAESAVRPLRSALMAAFRFCGVTPALLKILPASLSFSTASASSSRSTVTNESPAFSPDFSAVSAWPSTARKWTGPCSVP